MSDSARTPPQDVAAERCVLGGMLISARVIEDVIAVIGAADYYRPAHAAIHDAIMALYESGRPVDPMTACAELIRTGEIARIGGAEYLHTLITSVPTAANAGWYARTVRDRAIQRRLTQAATRIEQVAYAASDVQDALALARAEVEAAENCGLREPAADVGHGLDDLIDGIENPGPDRGITVPWTDLADMTGPLDPKTLTVVGARPAVGKSTFATDLCRHVTIDRGTSAAFVSLEMARDEVQQDILAAEASVDVTRLQGRVRPNEGEWSRIAKAIDSVRAAPLLVDDTPGADLASLRALVRRHRPKLLVIDYAQLVTPPKAKDRQEAMDALGRGLKLLAKSEDVPIVVLAQLNRASEARSGGVPMMSDLRESGGWEQHADKVLLLHRPDMRDPHDRPGECDVIVAKNRQGRTGTVVLLSQLHFARFVQGIREWA